MQIVIPKKEEAKKLTIGDLKSGAIIEFCDELFLISPLLPPEDHRTIVRISDGYRDGLRPTNSNFTLRSDLVLTTRDNCKTL